MDRLFSSAAGSSNTKSSTNASSSSQPYDTTSDPVVQELPNGYKKLASGVVLDASGNPCRRCTSGSDWMKIMMKKTAASSSSRTTTTAGATGATAALLSNSPDTDTATTDDCPPDVDVLGRSTWTLLHSMAAAYPVSAPPSMQATTRAFVQTFSQLYPCGYCAEDFRGWLKEPGNEVRPEGQDAFGDWACRAHNAVNAKLGKKEFDCALWKERWRDGWRDGRCG